MELSKQEMELFLLFPDFRLKNFLYKMFLSFNNDTKTGFENRKCNYPNRKWKYFSHFLVTFTNKSKTGFENRKWNYTNRKWNYFSYFQISDTKTSFTKCFQILPRSLKLVSKTGNGIVQTRNLSRQESIQTRRRSALSLQSRIL